MMSRVSYPYSVSPNSQYRWLHRKLSVKEGDLIVIRKRDNLFGDKARIMRVQIFSKDIAVIDPIGADWCYGFRIIKLKSNESKMLETQNP